MAFRDNDMLCEVLHGLKLLRGILPTYLVISLSISISYQSLSPTVVIFMQQLTKSINMVLPVKTVRLIVVEFCNFHERSFSKEYRVKTYNLEKNIAITLCWLEIFFTPLFFEIMVHLTITLAREANICGAVQYRRIYPFRRHLFARYLFM